VEGGGGTHDGRGLLSSLVGRPIQTISGASNEILEVRSDDVVVATGRSPTGQPVPIALVQDALDRLHATEELQIGPSTVGYRSAFIGAVLRTLPNARVKHDPQRIVLDWSPAEWDLPVGALLSRAERKERFGGAMFGGIEPSRRSPNVFLYSDPSKGEAYGYNYDGWTDNGRMFLYTGEGRVGDQLMNHGNRAILEHRDQDRSLRLFVADGWVGGTAQRSQRYIGEFEIDHANPYALQEAPDANDENRTVFVFRLRSLGEVLRRDSDESAVSDAEPEESASLVAVEENIGTSFEVGPREATTATRREGELVDRYLTWMGLGHVFGRWKLRAPDQLRPLLTDIYDETENILYEAKGTATRVAIRMAIGQLFDYRRHIDRQGVRLAILLPHRPSDDLVELVTGLGIAVVAEKDRGGFESIEPR
jgi:hypothetical protein